jgi:hypothetical protein
MASPSKSMPTLSHDQCVITPVFAVLMMNETIRQYLLTCASINLSALFSFTLNKTLILVTWQQDIQRMIADRVAASEWPFSRHALSIRDGVKHDA